MADLNKIYNALREKGVVTKSYEEFANAMADGNKRKNVYNALAQQGLITKSYKQFSDAVAPSNAPQTTQSTSTAPRNNDWVKQGLSVLKGVPSMPTPNIPSYRPTPLKPSEQNFDEIIANGSVYKDDNTYNSVVSGLDERIKQAQQQYDALLKQHSQNVKKGRKEASFWERLGAMPDVDDVPTKTSDDVLTPESDQLRAARETLHRLQNTRVQLERGRESKTQGEELDKRKKNGSGLLERAAYKTAISLENFGKGFMDALRGSDMWATNDAANDLMAVKNIVHKVDKWNALTDKEKSAMTSDDLLKVKPTDEELEILNNYALAYNVNAQAQDPISSNWSYMAGGVSANSALFGIEMAASGGMNVSSSAGRAIEKGALKLSQKAVKNGLEKLVGKTFEKSLARKIAGGVGQLPVQFGMGALESTVLQNGLTERKAQEYEIGTPLMSMDENGALRYSGSLGKLDAKSAHNRALVEQTIENQTEMLGGQIGEVLGGLTKVGVKVLNKTKLGENITKLMTDVSSNQFNRIMNNALNTAGYNGFLGEYLEEHAGDVEQALFLGTMTFDTDPETGIYNKEHILETMSGLAPMMGGHMVMEGTSYGASRARMAMMLSMAERKGSKLFGGERWAQVKQSLGGLDNQQFADKLSSMLQDKTLSDKQKKAVYNYAFYEKARQGFELMSLKQDMEGAVSLIDKNSRTNFVIGYEKGGQAAGELLTNLQKAQRNLRVRLGDYGYRQLFEENGDDFNKAYNSGMLDTDQKKQAYLDYVNALSCYQGALQRLHNDKKSELVNAKTDVDNIMDEQGNIVSATTTDGKKVNIVNGNVVLNEDGSVNVEKSGSLVVVDSDGKRKMISASEVASVDSATKASDVLAQKNKEIVDKYAAEEMSQKIQVGAQLPILTPNGSGIATIVSVNEDGSVSFKMGDSENIITTDAYNLYVMNLNAEVSSALREDDDAEQSTESVPEVATEGERPLTDVPSPAEESREYAQGDVFDVVVDGQKMHAEIVSPKDADGRFVVNVDDGESMRTLYVTPEELAAMEYREEPSPKAEETRLATEGSSEKALERGEQPTEEHTPTALERIPRDEKGNAQFHDVDTETAWDGLVEMSGNEETAHKVAEASLANAERKLKAAKALKEEGETPEELLRSIKENEAVVAEAQRVVDAWKAIVGEKSRREAAAKAEAERIATEKAEAERIAAEERERAEAEEEARVEAERKAEEERKTKEEERKERDENGQPFVVSSDGTTTFGEITEDTGLTAAPIKLSEGVADEKGNGYGLRHIEARHGDQIRKAGFSSVEEFVKYVASNYDKHNIKIGKKRANGVETYLIQAEDEHSNMLYVELSKDGSYWNVNSGGIFRKGYAEKKKDVGQNTEHPTSATTLQDKSFVQTDKDNGSQSADTHSDKQHPSADKGTTLPADQQTSDKENTKKVADSEGENTLKAKIEAASADVNTEPTEAQKEAGNYKKGHVQVGTFDITIEQPEGSIRRGTDADGKKWESKMHNTYGYFRGTEGVDGDHIDVFLSNDIDGWNGRKVFVVDQYNPDGTFDEHKVMLGFNDMDEAKSDYLANYEKGWENGRRITVSTTNLEDFEKWIDSSHRKTKPFSEYSSVNKETVATDKGGEKAEKKQKKQSVFDKAKEIADKEEKKRKAEADKPKQKPLTEAERKDAEEVAGALGYRVEWVDTMEENGTIDADKKVIRIAKDAENPLVQVLGHEVTHGVKRMDGGKFKALQKAAMEVAGEKEWNERIEKKRKLNAYAEGKLAEEVTCDIVGEALNDKDALKRLAESLRGEKGILARLRDAVARMVEYFKNRGDKEGVRRMKAADKLLAEFESALKEGVAPEQVKPEDVDRSVRESRSEKTDLTAAERELRDNLVERMRKGGLDVVTDSEEMQRVIDTENERTRMMGAGSVREHRVYHGSGADFDAFDHSHMGEGEGAQAYGWGTYVTEVEGIGKTYAIQNTTKHNDALRALQHDVDAISDQLNRQRDDLKYDEEQLKRANEWRAEAELDYELFKDEAEKLKEKYGESSPKYRNHLFNDIYTDEMKRAQSSVKSTEESIQYRKEKIAELEKALKDKQAEIDELPKEFPRHLYTVEIPDDNGGNYLDWNGHPAESLLKDVGSFLESNGFERVQDSPVRYEKGESTIVLNPNATGADLYAELQQALGSDKKASQALAELGCIGIKYPADNMRGGRKDGARNYVIFNENDAKITDHTRFLRTADGEVYGLVKDGRIYLDPKVATAETAVHEYTHLWGDMLRRKDSEQWSHTVKELKNSVLWEEVKELYPELKTDDEIADEVLSTFSGRRGAERLREEARRVADGEGGVFTKAKAIETLERVKEAIARFWEGVARMFGINRYRSAEELADMAMRDLLDSKNPMKDESGMRKRGEVGETLATSGTYFSGGGLLEAGLKGVIDPKVAVEFSEKIAGVYADNHGNHIVVADVRDVDPKKLVGAVDGGEVQYFHASPVCKNFSKAKREGGEVELDKETALSTAEFIAKTRPKVVTIENVKGYRNSEALKIITDELTRQGYDWDADVYNTADYGGYTKRERLIVRAKRDGKLPPKPEKLPEELRKKGWYSAVEDLIPHLEEKKTGVPQGTDERLKNSGIDYRTIDKPLYVFGRGYANKTVGHAFADELLPTLTTGGGDIIIMPDGRVLKASPRVLARVTGLPDTYKMPETDQLSHTIVGNGIPTQLTEGVIAPLLDNAIPSAERATKRESVFDVADRVSQNLEERTRAMAVKKANDRFNEELELQVKGELEEGHVYKLGMPSEILLSTGVPNLPIQMSAQRLEDKATKFGHNFDIAEVKDLVNAIQKPIAIFEYGDRNKSQNLIVEIQKDGKNFIIGLSLNPVVKGKALEINSVRNVFPKDNAEWLNWISQNKLLYADKEKIQALIDKQQTNLADVNYLNLDDVAKKVKDFENPKLFDGKISEVDKKGSDSIDRSVRENPKSEEPRFSRKPGESIFDYASRVSEDVDRSVRERVSARDEYEKKVKSKGFQTKEALQNSMLGLQEFMSAIDHASGNKRYIEDIPDFENPILGENRLSSVNKEEMHQVAKTQFKPLMSAVAKLSGNGKESGELYDYMFAKHGLERDAVMRQREAQKEFDKYQKANPKGTKTIGDFVASLEGKDYAGLTALTAEDGRVKSIQSQIDAIDEQMKATDDQLLLRKLGGQKKRLKVDLLNAARDAADDIRKAFESNPSHDRSDINELWKRVNEVNGNTLRKLYESGMLTKEAYNDISSMYTNYIPMRGFDQTTSADAYAYLTHGDSAFNAPIKTAKGRSSKADNPIAYMQAMAESAIMQGNRNVLVKQKMLNFVRNHPSDLASVSDVWLQYDSVADEWKPVFPDNIDANDSASVVAKKMEAFEDKMKQMAEKHPDLVQRSNEAPDIPYKVVEKGQLNEHQVLVKQNGKSYIITVNGSPRAAQAANGLTNPDTDLTGAVGKVFEGAEALNRQLSSLYTTLNPDFIGSNYVRDALYSNTMVYVKEGAKYGGSFNLNFAKYNPAEMANLYARYNKGSLDTSNETHRLFLEFMQNGGETGFVNLKQIEKRKSEIAKAIKRDGRISAAQIWGGLGDAVDFANRAVENSARFAAYVTSRKSGRSVGRSVYDAKEISVNFNRKGSGSKFMGAEGQTKAGNAAAFMSGAGRGLYIFWNAGLQGLTNFSRQIGRHPGRALTLAALLFGFGALMSYLGNGDDDDENNYFNLPKYIRRSNVCYKIGDLFVTIPLPVEYRSFYGLGELASSALAGKEDGTTKDIAKEAVSQVSQLFPIDFAEGGGGLHALIPSAVKPIVEAETNTAWTGLPIYKDNDFNKNMPEYTKVYKTANGYLVEIARALNDATGGNKYKKGFIDINPAKMEYVLKGMLGGAFSFPDKLVKTTETIMGDREFDWRNTPFANRFVKNADERTEYKALNEQYFKLKDEMDVVKQQLKGFEKEADAGNEKYEKALLQLEDSKDYERLELFKDYEKELKGLNDELKELRMSPDYDKAEEKELQKEIAELQRQLLDEMREIKK